MAARWVLQLRLKRLERESLRERRKGGQKKSRVAEEEES